MEKKDISETNLILRNDVYQSNPLIQARKNFDIMSTRIFFLGLRGLNPHFSEQDKYFDVEFKELFIPTSKLTEVFGGNTWYLHDLEKVCDKMFRTVVKIRPDDGGFELYHLFRKLKYVPNKGLYIWFDDLLRPYILDLFESRGYTRINVSYMFRLSSPYAVRLLELLLQYQNIRQFKELMEIKRKLTIDELRFSMNVPEGTYKDRIDHFRKFVLDDPIREINTRTPYIVRYETIKQGRRIVAFEFALDTYNVPKDDDDDYKLKFGSDAIQALCSLGFTERIARTIFAKCYDTADCFSRINRAQAVLARNKRPVRNKLGFLRKAIEENWQVGREKSRRFERSVDSTRTGRIKKDHDSMTSIGQILNTKSFIEDLIPDKPQSLSIGRKKMPYTLAEVFINAIRKGQTLDLVEEHLRDYNTTIEKFIDICEKQGL